MVIVAPVRGLRPSRAPRSATWNFPNPVKLTSSPELSASSSALITASTAEPASFLLSPLWFATRSTNSFLVMALLLVVEAAKLTAAPDTVHPGSRKNAQIAGDQAPASSHGDSQKGRSR